MRLSFEEKCGIKEIVLRHVPNAKVYIFGSRLSDISKGGDIDILIIDRFKIAVDTKLDILTDLNMEIAEQKYDIVTFREADQDPFKLHVLKQAIVI